MRYLATKACQDVDGTIYADGQVVDLEPGRHTKYLRPLEGQAADTADAAPAEVIQIPTPARAAPRGRAKKKKE